MHPDLFIKANSSGVILVLPEATVHPESRGTLWMNKPFDNVVDDRAFFTHLLEQIDSTLNVNRKRVYACGFSSGGAFSHYLASTTTGLLAAIAPVCTQTGWNEPNNDSPIVAPPPPLEPIAVMMVRGTNDTTRPFYGGTNNSGNPCRSAAQDVAYWTAGNSCVGGPINTPTPYGTAIRYAACAGTTEVRLTLQRHFQPIGRSAGGPRPQRLGTAGSAGTFHRAGSHHARRTGTVRVPNPGSVAVVLIRIDGMPHLWPDAANGFGFDANVSVIDFLLLHARP